MARDLLERALDLGSEDQTTFVRREASSVAIADRVLKLLAQEESTDDAGSLDEPLFGFLDSKERSRDLERLGPWELRSRIGRGGMADVWLAARADGTYRRRVAIKKLHPGLVDREIVARFERERQILATLSDPGIAKMLGAGTGPDGTPYIVMELIEGQRIDEYADERHLGIRERVQLVVKVADAVMAAHRMHVVHRDIKPSNILVDIEGRPTLLDFGVATVLDPEKSADSMVTLDVNRYLTPNYASPEQMRGQPLRATSDVYSLGALTYELITGVPPLNLLSLSTVEALEHSASKEPLRAKDAFQGASDPKEMARRRGVSATQLTRALSDRDLEAILDAALRKEPARRPPDAGAFRDELQRWLQGDPVLSRRDGPLRKAWRSVRRHRVASALTAALVLAIGTGYWSSWTEARRARRANALLIEQSRLADERLRDLRESLRVVLTDSVQTLAGVRGTQHALDRILRRGIAIAERQDDPILRLRLGEALIRKAELDMRRSGPSLNVVKDALRALDLLDASFEALGRTGTPTLAIHTLTPVSNLRDLGEMDRADEIIARATSRLDSFLPETPAQELKASLARGRIAVAQARVLETRGEFAAVVQVTEEALREVVQQAQTWEEKLLEDGSAERAEAAGSPPGEDPSYLRDQIKSVLSSLRVCSASTGQEREVKEDGGVGSSSIEAMVNGTFGAWEGVAGSHGNNAALSAGFLVSQLDGIRLAAEMGEITLARQAFGGLESSLPSRESKGPLSNEAVALTIAVHIRALLAEDSGDRAAWEAVLHDAVDLANFNETTLAPSFFRTQTIAELVLVAGQAGAALGQVSNASAQITRSYTLFEGLAEASPEHFFAALGCCEAALGLHELLETDADAGTPWLDRAHQHFAALPGDELARATIEGFTQRLWAASGQRAPK